MADLKSPEHPLELLPAMLNLVLIQTGKLLRDPECRAPRAIGLTKSKVNEFVPAANGRFHDALDEIEIKILDAKAVIERDLSAIRRKRAVREGVKVPSIAASPIEALAGKEGQESAKVKSDVDFDLPMMDADTQPTQMQEAASENQPHVFPEAPGAQTIIAEQALPQDAADSAGLAITIPSETKPEGKDTETIEENTTEEIGPKMEDIMASTHEMNQHAESTGADFDFDSMFNDADLTAVDGAMNFDVNFSTAGQDASQGHNILSDSAFESIDMTGPDPTNGAPTANADITGLLDDVFNQAGETANDNAVPVSTLPNATKTAVDLSQAPAQPAESGSAPSQFDELFGTDTFDLGENDEVIGGDGNLADFDFDEEWLKM